MDRCRKVDNGMVEEGGGGGGLTEGSNFKIKNKLSPQKFW